MSYKLLKTVFVPLLCYMSMIFYGCASDKDDIVLEESNVVSKSEKLYKELVGTYNLIKSEITFTNQPKQALVPPDVTGTMTIKSDRSVTQRVTVSGITLEARGKYEVFPDDGIMIMTNEPNDVKSSMKYTWDGKILTTELKMPTFTEKDFWQKR